MEPRISIICLGVADLERSLAFYQDGLGLPTTRRAEDGIVFFQTRGTCLEKPAHDTDWGGYSGYFSDPDGYLWEVAYGAFDFNDDGSLAIT